MSGVPHLCRFVSCVWTIQDELYEFKCDMRKSRGELAAQEKEVTAEVKKQITRKQHNEMNTRWDYKMDKLVINTWVMRIN